jgi:hypothetical protein
VIEALLFNVPRIRSPGEACVTALAVLAPGLAALVLWRARLRRRSLAGDR